MKSTRTPSKGPASPKKARGAGAPIKTKGKTRAAPRQRTRTSTVTTTAAATPAKKVGPRADYGAPIDGFFAKQPPPLRAILDRLRQLIDEAAPDATSSIKWGMPFYTIGDGMMCAIAGFKAHVNLILSGPPGTYADPGGLLEGGGKTGRHLKICALDELPLAAVRGWLRTAADQARSQT